MVGTRLQSGKGRIPEDLTAVSRDGANQTCGKKYSGKSFQELLLDFFFCWNILVTLSILPFCVQAYNCEINNIEKEYDYEDLTDSSCCHTYFTTSA